MSGEQGNHFFLLAKVISAYVGAVIGAGFASGQEIMQFFVLHGVPGLYGVLLAGVLFAYLGGTVMCLAIKLRSDSYKGLLTFLLGTRAGRIVDILNMLMLLGGLSIMMAGSAAIFGEHFGLSAQAGIGLVVLVTALVIWKGLNGVLIANVILVPLKLVAVIFITLVAISAAKDMIPMLPQMNLSGGVGGSWVGAGFLYVSYNMVVPLAVLSTLGRSVPLKVGVAGGVIGGLLLGISIALVALASLLYYPESANYEIPLLYLAGQLGGGFYIVLGILIWLAIITTAIANAHGIASRLAVEGSSKYRFFGIVSCLLALPAAGFGFSYLVGFLYPLFGCAGFLLLFCLLVVPPIKLLRKYKRGFLS